MSHENSQARYVPTDVSPALHTTGASHATHGGDVTEEGVANYGNQNVSGSARIGHTIINFTAPHLNLRAPSYDQLKYLIKTKTDWTMLRGHLSIIDQDQHRSEILRHDWNEPKFYWITKNIDFTQWESANDSRALFLSAPPGHGTTEVCAHVIDLAKENSSQTNNSVLHFFCSTATEYTLSTVLTHTLLNQIVCCSSAGKADSIATAFLNTLLGGHFRQRKQDFKEDDPLNETMKKILNAPENVLMEALAEAIKKARIQNLSIIVDGLWGDIAYWLVKLIMSVMQATPKLKALLTSAQNPDGKILDGMLCIEYDKERQECLRALQHDDTRYDKISDEHHGSLEWLWKHPQYLKWSTCTTSSLLYIEGKPGSGKSTLAKFFKKNLAQQEPSAGSSTVVHYFYTLRGTILESTHENMVRSILYSLLKQDESAFFHFQQEFRNFRLSNRQDWPYDSLKTILSSFATHPSTKPVFLILDAMDESNEDDRRNIIQLLCKLCSEENPCNVKVFLASRPLAELKHRIQERHQVIIMQDQNKHDISRFADHFLSSDLKLTGEILDKSAAYITSNAQGVFVWVSLVKSELLKYIETGYTDAEFLRVLEGLPQELEDFYKFMFDRLENGQSRDVQDGIRLFRLVLFALRPLTVVELCDALAVPHDQNPSYEDFRRNRISEIERRIEHCGADKTVQIMHQTAREFLISTIPTTSTLKFEINDNESHGPITSMCVRYLMLCFTSSAARDRFSKIDNWGPEDYRVYVKYLNEWPLLDYTFRYIKDHHDRDRKNESVSPHVITLVRQLTDNQVSYFLGHWMTFRFGQTNSTLGFLKGLILRRERTMKLRHTIHIHKHRAVAEDFQCNTLNAAAELRLSRVSEALLQPCVQRNGNAHTKTPLMISAQKGLVAATRLLLEKNVDKNAKDRSGWTALHYAVENEDEAMVRLLVEQGADKTIKDNRNEAALHLAVKRL
ncbi:hypothetical protein BDD12DRAFT_902622 [Trichophaea hybrida]|nr:hypothetical protein BDD12DRAFT_902622 [Trichophaea hybrida]